MQLSVIFYFLVFTVSVFENKKKSSMVTVFNNLGADLKERSVCESLRSLWSAAETQTRSQSSEDRAPFQASSFYLDSAN